MTTVEDVYKAYPGLQKYPPDIAMQMVKVMQLAPSAVLARPPKPEKVKTKNFIPLCDAMKEKREFEIRQVEWQTLSNWYDCDRVILTSADFPTKYYYSQGHYVSEFFRHLCKYLKATRLRSDASGNPKERLYAFRPAIKVTFKFKGSNMGHLIIRPMWAELEPGASVVVPRRVAVARPILPVPLHALQLQPHPSMPQLPLLTLKADL